MTNQEQYDDIWKSAKKVPLLEEEIKSLVNALDRTTKQRNALIIALNYVNNTMIAMKWGADARPEDMERIVKNALLMAVEKSEGSIKLEVKEDDN
jgi:hypothetical protein